MLTATRSCLLADSFTGSKKSESKKSDSKKQILLFFVTLLKYSKAFLIFVFLLVDSKVNISLIILKICFFPFEGEINFSILSEKKITPTLSLFFIAEKARTADISETNSLLNLLFVPKLLDELTSTISIKVISLSSSKTFTNGLLYLAVTFQSIVLKSSPISYSLTSEKVMPLPLKAVLYSPAKI